VNILTSIKKTIAYAEKFDCNLSVKEIKERLISDKIYNNKDLDKMIKTICPRGGGGISLDKANFAKEKVKKAEELARLIEKKFKDILFLGITGSVAAGYPKEQDDIDLLIITKPHKLWLTRLKLRLFVDLNKIPHRKFGKKERKDEFCFNLWLDLSSLKLISEKQNIKNAVDLILLKKLINKNKTYERFIKENDWAKKFVINGYSSKLSTRTIVEATSLDREALLDKVVNWLVFWPQYWYMKKRIKNEKVGLHEAFFHH
jgi:hypothetical protein